MFRSACLTGCKFVAVQTKLELIRTKVVKASSILTPAQKIKLYNKENKELFGPLLDKKKSKKYRSQKNSKNSLTSHQNIKAGVSNESAKKFSATENVHVLINNSTVRGIKTFVASNAAISSPAEPGYVSEDKILQIKPHQNDFAKQIPSVTLVLNKTMTEESKAALEKWKQERIAELGQDEFNKFCEAQLALGTKFHSTLKNYFTQPRSQLRIDKDVEGVWVSVADVLKNISMPKAIESNVVHPVLKYRGIFDAIADYEDKPTLIEWKKSDKLRKAISMTYDNPVQLAAYFGAVCNDLNYKHLNVRDALLVIAYTDGSKADVFHLSTDKLREHWAQWLIRLEEYTKKFNNDSEKILKGGKRLFEEDTGNL
ncbi:mitochondrial genome maintenance exonuclease 1-like isoform X2 [Battus philenor]|uniref:mitochondrial genome maintenance exonuclease 1-like isoform X2 n=1 Tax=Battus philenor TaxID=42288 RepID=UPI0035CFABFE